MGSKINYKAPKFAEGKTEGKTDIFQLTSQISIRIILIASLLYLYVFVRSCIPTVKTKKVLKLSSGVKI